jgi:hypothetical protein
VVPCGSCKNQRVGGTYRLHHQGDKNRRARNFSNHPLMMEAICSLKRRFLQEPYSITYQKTALSIHYRIHKLCTHVLTQSQTNPIHTTSSCLTNTHLTIIHQPTHILLFQVVFGFRLSHKSCVWSQPGDLYFFNFPLLISSTRKLGPGTNGSAVYTSVCLTSLTLCSYNNRKVVLPPI